MHARPPRGSSKDVRNNASQCRDGSLPPIFERNSSVGRGAGVAACLAPSGDSPPPRRAGSQGARRAGSALRVLSGGGASERGEGSLPPIGRGPSCERQVDRAPVAAARGPSSNAATGASVRSSSRGARPPPAPNEASRIGAPDASLERNHGAGYGGRPQRQEPRRHEPRGRGANGYGGNAPQAQAASPSRSVAHAAPALVEVHRAAEEVAERAMALAEAEQEPLRPCPHCGRSFKQEALERHVGICQKVFQQKRKVYNTTEHRLPDEPELVAVRKLAKQCTRRGEVGIGAKKDVAPVKSAWREKSKQFRAAMRDARVVDKFKREGRPMRELPPARPTDPALDDRTPCPHCGRKFGAVQAERHIPHCKNSKANAPRPAAKAAPAAPRSVGATVTRPRRVA